MDAGEKQVVNLIRGEVCAVFEARVCWKSVLGDGSVVGGGDIGEKRDNIKTDHDVIWLESEVLDESGKLVWVFDVMYGVAHQGLEDPGEVPSCVILVGPPLEATMWRNGMSFLGILGCP